MPTVLQIAIDRGAVRRKWKCEKCEDDLMVGPFPADPTEEQLNEIRWLCPRCRHHVELVQNLKSTDIGEED